MAVVNKNIITQSLSSALGDQIIFRKGKGGQTIVSTKPAANRERTFNTD